MAITIRWKPLFITIIIGILTYGGYFYWQNYYKVIPEDLMARTMEQLGQLESYRYRIKLELMTEGYERYISQVEGIRTKEGDFHLQGTIEGTPIEAYHIGDITYLKTGEGEKWMTIPGNKVFTQDLFMVEINPLASFNFIQVNELSYLGRKEFEGRKLHVLRCKPELDHPFMVKYWHDFTYELMVRINGELIRTEVEAILQAKPNDSMTMVIELMDYNQSFHLTPPVQ